MCYLKCHPQTLNPLQTIINNFSGWIHQKHQRPAAWLRVEVTTAFSTRSCWNIRRAGSAAAVSKVCQIVSVSYLQLFMEPTEWVGSRSSAATASHFNLCYKCLKLRTQGFDDLFKTGFKMFLHARKPWNYLTKSVSSTSEWSKYK